MPRHHLGEFEELVLLAILGLPEDETYAVPIQQRLTAHAQRDVTLGSVYRTLSRLEQKGFVRSWMGAITHEKGGKRKRFYAVTGYGQTAVVGARDLRQRLWDYVDVKPALLKPGLTPS